MEKFTNENNPGKGKEKGTDKKVFLNVLIENNQIYSAEFVEKQKLKVIIEKTVEHFNLADNNDRTFYREDGTVIQDLNPTIEDIGLYEGETLRYLKKSKPRPGGEGFAFVPTSFQTLESETGILSEQEITAVKNGYGGKFKFVKAFNIESGRKISIAAGSNAMLEEKIENTTYIEGILIFGSCQEIKVLIEVPPTFPDIAAAVIPVVDYNLSNDDQLVIHFQKYENTHQFINGAFCQFKNKEWDNSIKNLGLVVRKAVEWLNFANSSEGFPVDMVEVEEIPGFNAVGHIIFPLEFIVPEEIHFGEAEYRSIGTNSYVIDKVLFEKSGSAEIAINGMTWTGSKEAFTNPLNKKIKGFWYALPENINEKDFLSSNLKDLLQKNCGRQFANDVLTICPNKEDKAIISIYLTGYNKWFSLLCTPLYQNGIAVHVQHQYLLPHKLKDEIFLRVRDIFNIESLLSKSVTIIGCGAIGSVVLDQLSRAGVGIYHLFDKDQFEIGNTVRNIVDLTKLWKQKVIALKELILERNPYAQVYIHSGDVMKSPSELKSAIIGSNLILDMTAEKSVNNFVNRLCVSNQKICIYAQASIGALTGVIYSVLPGKSACINCLEEYGNLFLPKSNFNTDHLSDLNGKPYGCAQPTYPGAGIDTSEIANQVARVSIQLLLGITQKHYPKTKGYQFIWHGPAGSKELNKPYHWQILKSGTHPNCIVCR